MSDPAPLTDALCALGAVRAEIGARDAEFETTFAALRAWQSDHVYCRHSALARRYDGDDLLDFLTRRFYRDADWSELTRRPQRVASAIGRIIADQRALVVALNLQATADRLDIAMTDALCADIGDRRITSHAYVRAFRRTGRRAERERQIHWLGELVELLGGYAGSRAAFWAFKLAAAPARALHLGETYALLAEGFAAMRTAQDLRRATREAVAAQRIELERLLGGH